MWRWWKLSLQGSVPRTPKCSDRDLATLAPYLRLYAAGMLCYLLHDPTRQIAVHKKKKKMQQNQGVTESFSGVPSSSDKSISLVVKQVFFSKSSALKLQKTAQITTCFYICPLEILLNYLSLT